MVFYGVFRESAGEKVKLRVPVYLERMIDIMRGLVNEVGWRYLRMRGVE